jgi:hypothetical protein
MAFSDVPLCTWSMSFVKSATTRPMYTETASLWEEARVSVSC